MKGHIINYGKLVRATSIAKSNCKIQCIFPGLNFLKTFGLYTIKLKKANFLICFRERGHKSIKNMKSNSWLQILKYSHEIHGRINSTESRRAFDLQELGLLRGKNNIYKLL